MAIVRNQDAARGNYSDDALKRSLTTFETSLLTPMVSGELSAWVDEVQKTWAEASAQVDHHLASLHPRQYNEISEQDPELLPRIDQLRAEDDSIEQQRSKLSDAIGRVSQDLPQLEPDEEKAQQSVQSIIDAGTAFLIQVRKQQLAVQTWYVEAFNRDDGTVD